MASSDMTLLGQWQKHRDAEAFRELVLRHGARVQATAQRVLGDTVEAEDIAQECFELLARSAKGPSAHVGAWLHKVATRRAIDRIRASNRRRTRDRLFVDAQDAAVEIAWDDIYAFVDEAMAELPDKLRVPLVAHFIEGRTHTDIARDIGLHRRTLTHRIAQGVEMIRKKLGCRGIKVGSATLAAFMATHLAEATPLSPALEAVMGKLAIAGVRNSAAGSSALYGGAFFMKKVSVGLVVLVGFVLGGVLLGGYWSEAASTHSKAHETSAVPPSAVPMDVEKARFPIGDEPARQDSLNPRPHIPPSSPPAGAAISGHMLDAKTGVGIVGGTLYVEYKKNREARRVAKSDATGLYRVEGLEPGDYILRTGPVPGYPTFGPHGLIRTKRNISVAKNEVIENMDFTFEPGVRVEGVVLGLDGAPMAGTNIAARLLTQVGQESAVSRDDGTFDVRVAAPGGDLIIQAQSDCYESDLVGPLSLPESGLEDIELRLTTVLNCSIEGVVVDPDGKPVPHAMVSCSAVDRLLSGGLGRSKPDGSFEIARLAAGEYSMGVAPPGTSMFTEVTRILLHQGQEPRGLRLRLGGEGGLVIEGRVTDTSGRPINDVLVRASGLAVGRGFSGEDGTFEIAGLVEGTYDLSANAPGAYGPASLSGVPVDTHDIEFVLRGQGAITGQVVRADTGEALQEFALFFHRGEVESLRPGMLTNGESFMHEEGRFHWDLDSGALAVTAQAPGFAPAFKNVEVGEHQTVEDIVFRLQPCEMVTGHVVNDLGDPVSGAYIYLGDLPSSGNLENYQAKSEQDGSFVLDSLPPSTHVLSAWHPSYAPKTVPMGKDIEVVLSSGGVVEGVVFANDQFLSGVPVSVTYVGRGSLPPRSESTDKDGAFRFTRLAAGEVDVMASLNGRSVASRGSISDGKTTVVDLDVSEGTSRIEGMVMVHGGAPRSGRLDLRIATTLGEQRFRSAVELDGSYQFASVPAGGATLRVEVQTDSNGALMRTEAFDVPPDETVNRNIAFAGTAGLQGQVVPHASHGTSAIWVLRGEVTFSEALDDASFARLLQDGNVVSGAHLNGGGSYAIADLDPGVYTVLAASAPDEKDERLAETVYATSVIRLEGQKVLSLDFDLR